MGTKVSAHALTRERLRTGSVSNKDDLLNASLHPLPGHVWTVPARGDNGTWQSDEEAAQEEDDVDESLSMSLLER